MIPSGRLALVLLVLAGAAAFASKPDKALEIDASKFPEVSARLRIPAEHIRVDLKDGDVAIAEDGTEVTPSRGGVSDSAALVLVLDTGPLVGPQFGELRTTALRALGALGLGPPAEIVLARDPVERLVPFTRVRHKLNHAVTELKVGGASRLSSAIRLATQDLGAIQAKSKVILALTAARDVDAAGKPLPPDGDLTAAVEKAGREQVPVCFVCFGEKPDVARAGDAARRSGGSVLLDPSAAELAQLFGEALPMVLFQYTWKAREPDVPLDKRARKVVALLRIPGYEGEVPAYYGGNGRSRDNRSGAPLEQNDEGGEGLAPTEPPLDTNVESTSGKPTGLTP